jgi:hypothetical protein
LQSHVRDGGIEKHRHKLKKGQKLAEAIEKGRRNTSGFMIANGHHSLNEEEALDAMQNRKLSEKKRKKEAKRKQRKEVRERIVKVKHLRQTKPNIEHWNHKDCSLFIQHKKDKNDPPKPKTIAELRKRCEELAKRPKSPTCSPHASDDEDNSVHMQEHCDEITDDENDEECLDTLMGKIDFTAIDENNLFLREAIMMQQHKQHNTKKSHRINKKHYQVPGNNKTRSMYRITYILI